MYWIQWHHARMRADVKLREKDFSRYQFGAIPRMMFAGEDKVRLLEEGGEGKMVKWQDFKPIIKKRRKVKKVARRRMRGGDRTRSPSFEMTEV